MLGYGTRYLTARQFVDYCSGLNVKLSPLGFPELQLYEREGLLLPMARVVRPREYVIKRWELDQQLETYRQTLPEWNELVRLLLPYVTDSDLRHPFDREFEQGNRFLCRPTDDVFRPWDSFYAEVELAGGYTVRLPSAEHYYHYWQVHQAYAIQRKYPVFAKHNWVLENLEAEVARFYKPQNPIPIATLCGKAEYFDALSFYIELYRNEEQRTLAPIPITDGFKQLNDEQSAHYQSRLIDHAKSVCGRYNLKVESLYEFLVHVLDLQTQYERDEHMKLAHELKNDTVFLARLVAGITDQSFDELEEEVGKRAPFSTKKQFRHLDKTLEVQDCAREDFERLMDEYNGRFPAFNVSPTDIDGLLKFVGEKGLFIIPYAIFDIHETFNNPRAFRRTSLYIGLSNLTAGLESYLREIAHTANKTSTTTIETETLHPLIKTMFSEWGQTFATEHEHRKQKYKDDAISYLLDVYTDPSLDEIVRAFIIAYRVRNLVHHRYILENDLYYGLYGGLYTAICHALFYSWMYASQKSWI